MKKETWKTASKREQRKLASDLPSGSSLFKFIIQTIIAILTALLTSLGVASCLA